MTAHTPGPWNAIGEVRLVSDTYNLWCGNIMPYAPSYRGDICSVQSADQIKGISREEAEANARLIAAAPDLLAALQRTEKMLTGLHPSENPHPDHLISVVRAAITKATGAA